MRSALLLTLALCGACVAPEVRSPAGADHRPIARVAVDHSQTETGLATGYDGFVRDAANALNSGDPLRHWVFEPRGPDFADVDVRHMTEEQTRLMGGTAVGLEYSGGDHVYVNPVGLAGGEAFSSVVIHELEHWAGGAHVCRRPGELPDRYHPNERCSPVGFGRAVLNPYLSYDSDIVSCNIADDNCQPTVLHTTHLTDLDRLELARGYGRRGGP